MSLLYSASSLTTPTSSAASQPARPRSSDRRAPSPRSSPRRTCTRTCRSSPGRPGSTPLRTARTTSSSPAPRLPLLLVEVEHGEERLLRDFDRADLLHALLALLLLLEQLPLARDVAAVALGEHVLPLGLDRLAGD